ncbi:MAG TPA: YceI family protein [Flavisolibacter sp.]|jgi:polyisoprenoid-binding protein YceI|nr:YceI family protein [Flavisolibacter sp.]
MKAAILIFMLTIIQPSLISFTPVEQGSSISFKIRNLGFSIPGSFTGIKGTISFDPNNITQSNFDVSIDASTVNTDNNMRDNHLRGESYFDVKNYPRIRLVSTRVAASNKKGIYLFYGKLNIKSTTKEISFPFTADATSNGYLFKGSFTMNRRDFNVGGASIISNDLEVSIAVLAK